MIPEELEKQIWQTRKEVSAGTKKRESKHGHVSGWEGRRAREGAQPGPFLCVGESVLELKWGNSFTDVLFPGAWLSMFCGVRGCSHSQVVGAY